MTRYFPGRPLRYRSFTILLDVLRGFPRQVDVAGAGAHKTNAQCRVLLKEHEVEELVRVLWEHIYEKRHKKYLEEQAKKADEPLIEKMTTVPEPRPMKGFDAIPSQLMDDPEVRQKMKELQLTRLERQIAEERKLIGESTALERLDGTVRLLIINLEIMNALDSDIALFHMHHCIWCGAERDKGMHYVDSKNIWKCRSCGREE